MSQPPIDVIPKGNYCYDENGVCPHWALRLDMPEKENGYCELMRCGDWEMDGASLLWDRVKECGINE